MHGRNQRRSPPGHPQVEEITPHCVSAKFNHKRSASRSRSRRKEEEGRRGCESCTRAGALGTGRKTPRRIDAALERNWPPHRKPHDPSRRARRRRSRRRGRRRSRGLFPPAPPDAHDQDSPRRPEVTPENGVAREDKDGEDPA